MIYASEDMCKSELGKRLQYWRCERPSEWIMDEFIGGVEKLSEENAQLKARVAELESELNSIIAGLHSESDINKIKADAIRKAAMSICSDNYGAVCYPAEYDDLNEYADKLERGES